MKRRLTRRERWMIGLGSVVCALILAWSFVGQPALDRIAALDRSIEKRNRELDRLAEMIGRWREITAQTRGLMGRLNDRERDFSLAGYLEDLVKSSGLERNLTNLRPLPPEEVPGGARRILADVKLHDAAMDKVVKLLYRIEFSDKMLSIARLSISAGPGGLDVSMRVLTLRPK